jgi:threonine/homoserine/homoserine lactone efflux protein
VLTFTAIAALAVMSPGADTLLVLRAIVERGTRAGLWTTAGICAGCTVHATLSAIGVSVLVTQSPRAYDALRLSGAAYLTYLGITSCYSALVPNHVVADGGAPAAIAGHEIGFRDGLIVNVLNPKVSLFYLALVPQFVERQHSIVWSYFMLTSIHILLGAAWFTLLSVVLGRIRAWLLAPLTRRLLDGLAGAIMIALALHTAFAS